MRHVALHHTSHSIASIASAIVRIVKDLCFWGPVKLWCCELAKKLSERGDFGMFFFFTKWSIILMCFVYPVMYWHSICVLWSMTDLFPLFWDVCRLNSLNGTCVYTISMFTSIIGCISCHGGFCYFSNPLFLLSATLGQLFPMWIVIKSCVYVPKCLSIHVLQKGPLHANTNPFRILSVSNKLRASIENLNTS